MLTTVEADDAVRGQAHVAYNLGRHLTQDFTNYFGFRESGSSAGIERAEFDAARKHLAQVGYKLRDGGGDDAWKRFYDLRRRYAVHLNTLARWLEIPPVQWVGDRSMLRGH